MKLKYKSGISNVLASVFLVSTVAMASDDPVILADQPDDDPPGLPGLTRTAGSSSAIPGVNGEIARGRQVDLEGMSGYLDFVLGNNVVGHAFVINQDGTVAHQAAGGMARTADEGALNMSVDTRTAVASVSKNITAAATIKALGMADVSLDAPVSPYLPGNWAKGKGFAGSGVTFRQLLAHESGLNQMYDDLAEWDKPS